MKIVDVNKDNFEEEVLKSEVSVLVDFNANWCGPCKMLKPILEEIACENNNTKIVSINVDNEDELANKYGINSIPCLILFKNGLEVTRNVGFISKEDINKMIEEETCTI